MIIIHCVIIKFLVGVLCCFCKKSGTKTILSMTSGNIVIKNIVYITRFRRNFANSVKNVTLLFFFEWQA